MFCAVRAAAPRSLFSSASAGGGVAGAWPAAGAGFAAGLATGAAGPLLSTGCGPVPLTLRTGR